METGSLPLLASTFVAPGFLYTRQQDRRVLSMAFISHELSYRRQGALMILLPHLTIPPSSLTVTPAEFLEQRSHHCQLQLDLTRSALTSLAERLCC